MKESSGGRGILENVRISFPNLDRKGTFGGVENNKFDCKFIIDPADNRDEVDWIKRQFKELQEQKGEKVGKSKLCLKLGDVVNENSNRPEYAGKLVLSASSKAKPIIVGANGKALQDASSLYAGVYANAKVSFWFQDNTYGKRINCELIAVQKAKDAEPFGQMLSEEDALEDFEGIDADDAEDFRDDSDAADALADF